MINIGSGKNLTPIRVFGIVFLLFGGFALFLEEPRSPARATALFAVTYLLWGLYFNTRVHSNKVIKKRGWFFPHFTSRYDSIKRIELRSSYIYQEGYGAYSRFALYVGVINGPFDQFIDLSWGVEQTETGEGYERFIRELQQLTGLAVKVDPEFATQFKNKFGYEYSAPTA